MEFGSTSLGHCSVDDTMVVTDEEGRMLVEVLAASAGPDSQRTNYTTPQRGKGARSEQAQ